MKFSKPKGESKTITAVDRGKFKSKEGASNGHVQKGTKVAAKLVKKGSFNVQLGNLVEVNAKSKIGIKVANGGQNKKKTGSKSLSPEVRLGLELDAMLDKKTSKNEKTCNETTSGSPQPKRKRKGQQATALNKPVVPTTDHKPNQTLAKSDSPNKKNKAKKLKRQIETENHSSPAKKQDGAKGTQLDSDVITPPKPLNAKAAGKKKKKREIETENHSSPVKKQDGAKGTPIDLDVTTPPKPQNAKAANKKNKKKIKSVNHSSPVKYQDGVKGTRIDSDGITLPKPQKDDKAAGRTKKNKGKKENLTLPLVDSQDYSLDPKEIQDAAKSLLQVYSEKKSSSKQLLQATDEPIFMYFMFYELLQKPRLIRFKLAHPLVPDGSDICLIGKDFAGTIDKSKTLWNEFLSKEDCSSLITEVIPLKSLLKDYMQHEYKRKLSNRFDCFIIDSRICHRAYSILGTHSFHHRRKTPAPVIIKDGNTKQNIIKALKNTVTYHKGCSDRLNIQIGHTGMTEQQLQENIINIWSQYPKECDFYWENISRAVLFTTNGPEFPIFANLNPPVNGPRPYNMVWTKKNLLPAVGELSNERDQIVTVYPSGKITLKGGRKVNDDGQPFNLTKAQRRNLQKKADEAAAASKKKGSADSSDDEFGGRTDMIDSDLEDSMMPEMELESDTEEEEEEGPVAKKGKKAEKSKQDNKTKTGKKNQKNSKKAKEEEEEDEEEEDSGEFDVDKAEELYLHDLAVEKKVKAKQMAAGKGKGNKKELAPGDSKEGSDSEGEMDDSAFGISSSDEDSDNDDAANIEPSDDNEPAKPVFGGKKANKIAFKPQQKGGKQAQQGKNIVKDTKKKVENNPKQKGKLNKPLNKPGAQKNRQQSSPNNSRQTNSSSTNSSPSTSNSGKKKNSFQGVKAEQIQAKKQKKNKMKRLKKKIAAKQKKEVA